MPAKPSLRTFDLRQITSFDALIGVDEAGRGALAGPVVAAAVQLDRAFLEGAWVASRGRRVNDSKQLSAEQREDLYAEFELLAQQGLIRFAYAAAAASEIDELNILGATKLAMRRSLEKLQSPEAFVRRDTDELFAASDPALTPGTTPRVRILVDGLRLKGFPFPHEAIVKGDGRSLSIAMASIVAKVVRDRLMTELGLEYPNYGFGGHKGYGTDEHRQAILAHGRCAEHREMFLRNLMARRTDPSQMSWLQGESEEQ